MTDTTDGKSLMTERRLKVGLVAGLVIALLYAGFATFQWRSAAADDALRAEVLTAGKKLAVAVRAYDWKTIDDDFARIRESSTGKWAQQWEKIERFGLKEVIVQSQATLTVTIPEIAVKSAAGDEAQLLVFVEETQFDKGRPQPNTNRSVVVMTMKRDDGRWLVEDMNIDVGGSPTATPTPSPTPTATP